MTVSNGDLLSVVLTHDIIGSSEAQLHFSFQVASEGSSENADVLADFEDWATNVWHPIWENIGVADGEIANLLVDVVDLQGLVLENVGTETLGLVGLASGGINAAADSGLLYASTDRPKTRGRKFIPGISDASFTGGFLTGSAVSNLLLLLLEYLTDIEGTTTGNIYEPGVRSNPNAPDTPSWQQFNSSGVVNDNPSYQRRRAPKSGS